MGKCRRPLWPGYLEAQLHQVVAFEGGVCAGHGDDLGLFHQQVFGSVQSTAQQLKRPELLQRTRCIYDHLTAKTTQTLVETHIINAAPLTQNM